MHHSWFITLTFAVSTLGLPIVLYDTTMAGGPVHGAKSAGMGTAFVAVADDPSAIMFNPAGLTNLHGTNIYGGGTAISLSSEYSSPGGASEKTESQIFFAPHFYATSDFGIQDKTFGLGIYSPFGVGGRKWPENGVTRYLSTEAFLGTISVNPTFAWQVRKWLSFGLGVDYMWSQNEAERMVNQSSHGAGDSKYSLELDGGGWGYNFGLLLHPGNKLSMGFAYRSQIRIKQEGTVSLEGIAPALQSSVGGDRFETGANMTVHFPDSVTFGVAYRPTEKTTLALDVEWIGWSSFDEQFLDVHEEVPQAGISDLLSRLDWKDTWTLRAGAEYRLRDRLFLRGGYAYIDTPVPDHSLTPANPDSDQHNFILGLGWKKGNWTIDTFYQFGWFEDRTVDNAILSGEYENVIHYVGFSIGQRF